MRQAMPEKLDKIARVRKGPYGTEPGSGWDGMYYICLNQRYQDFDGSELADIKVGVTLKIICSTGLGWDHVSASGYKHELISNEQNIPNECFFHTPTWEEMCHVKDLFFEEEETVMQLHPPKSEYRNLAENCLHLWRPQGAKIPRPLPIMVAPDIEAG